MADRKWTSAQEEAILAQGCNILVSAAAGSGKTAVLVERVIRKITDPEAPSDIDRLLVMTFTRAAAAQMKSKIFDAIREKLKEQPDNRFLRQQLMKVQNARICTIDSLCAEIVRDHIEEIDLDPGYRLADEAQIRILQADVLQSVLEKMYQEGSEEFLELAQYYVDKSDNKLEDIILKLFSFARSHPEPEPWLKALSYPYEEAGTLYSGEIEHEYPDGMKNWMEEYAFLVGDILDNLRDMAERGLAVSEMNHGPAPYADAFRKIKLFLTHLADKPFDYRAEALERFLEEFPVLPAIRKKDIDVDPSMKDAAKELKDLIKKELEDLKDSFLYDSLEQVFGQMADCGKAAKAISSLTIRFSEELDAVKKEKKIADFSDIAHYALQVLIRYDEEGRILRDENGDPLFTETADAMAVSLDEIIVDEYQDTNYLQEYLVKALSRERFGSPDVFMVGDIKQSIYRFRMACPELFNEKLRRYVKAEENRPFDPGRLIILDTNFRSRKEVLDVTNLVFSKVMTEETGGIDYQHGHSLSYGGLFGAADQKDPDFLPEIYMITGSSDQAKYLEGYKIAVRIEELVAEGKYRFSDMAILTQRSDNPQLEEILRARGIPVIKTSRSGFFDSFEIRLILDLLKIIDNPFQDIPFAAVLYSPLCGAETQDLAKIRLAGEKTSTLFECFRAFCSRDPKFQWFLEKLQEWRERAVFMGLSEFLSYILEDSGLYTIFAAMPEGDGRRANTDLLRTKAQEYANGSCTGLFQFLRYIKELQEIDVDFGSAGGPSGEEAVRMMTMHRSKGLEFPVVFLACCGIEYNEQDLRFNVIADRELGLGIEYRDTDTRLIRKTILMQTIRQKQRMELYAEEMRLLYVAMTRAKEKLIITGTDRNLSSRIKKWEAKGQIPSGLLPPDAYQVKKIRSHLGLLGETLYRDRETTDLYRLECPDSLDLEAERVLEVAEFLEKKSLLKELALEEAGFSEVSRQLEFVYPYRGAAYAVGKKTASQLENREHDADYRQEEKKDRENRKQRRHSVLTEEDLEALTGAERGNAYHRFLELYDYGKDPEEQLKELQEKGKLSKAYAGSIDPARIRQFLDSSIGKRMKLAYLSGNLFRERQFVMGNLEDLNAAKEGEEDMPLFSSDSRIPDEELILIQGIVDAYFIEEDPERGPGIILVDYKTDRIHSEEYYRETYSPQLAAYADALERSTGYQVRERIIYSLELGKEIEL